ncbi:MAG TPA: FtsX-like permease family protein [Polyangia bacterium]|jgi:putative ABC transport system permease protein|nr:FtsX-like permease family protein [Polyangia bacterium]
MNPSLELGPILRSLRHHKGAFSLLVLEVALGFVMLTHTMIAIRNYYRLYVHALGLPEDQLVVARRRFLQPRDIERARDAARADLAAMNRIAPAAAVDTAPLPDAAAFPAVLTRSQGGRDGREVLAWPLYATPGVAAALGIDVVFGTGLDAAGVADARGGGAKPVLLTWSVAEKLFGTADRAVGRDLACSTFGTGHVVGVARDFAFRGGWVPAPKAFIVVPAQAVTEHEIIYVLRAPAGRRDAVISDVTAALAGAADPDATIVVKRLERETTRFAQLSSGAVIILIWTGFLVVAVALAGSLALASFSVAERTRQIGVRRALGASRGEIVRYFLLENLVLTTFGLALGLGLAAGMNQLVRRIMEDMVLTADVALLSMTVFLTTGLLSALVPARRAALIPPWAATRTL